MITSVVNVVGPTERSTGMKKKKRHSTRSAEMKTYFGHDHDVNERSSCREKYFFNIITV